MKSKKVQKQYKTAKAKLMANAKYLARQKEIKIRLDPEKDAELIEWLDSKDNKQQYIKALIRENMDVIKMMRETERRLAEEEDDQDPEADYYRDLEEVTKEKISIEERKKEKRS